MSARLRIVRAGTRLHLSGGPALYAHLRPHFWYWRDCARLADGTVSVRDSPRCRAALIRALEGRYDGEEIEGLEEVTR